MPWLVKIFAHCTQGISETVILRRESLLFLKTREGYVVWYSMPGLVCRFQVHSAALNPVITLAELDVEGEQQVVNSFKINGNFCFTLIKLPFLKSKSSIPNRCML